MTLTRRLAFALFIGLGGLAVLVGLGLWQMQRLEWKEALIADLEARLSQPAIVVSGNESVGDDNLRRARAVGRFVDAEPARFLTSLKPHGPGHRLISAFQLEQGERILVDRGYLPDHTPLPAPPTGPVELTGALQWPNEISSFTPDPNLAERLWFARDVPSLAAALGTRPVMLVLDAQPGASPTDWPKPMPVSVDLPNDHLGYAVTWFSLAAIWLVMTALLMRGRIGSAD